MDLLTSHQQKALNFKEHISLTANAGSGKTFVLSRRYLEIAFSEQGSLRKIAAITFTDKAASELYKKIAELVENRYKDCPIIGYLPPKKCLIILCLWYCRKKYTWI